MPNSTPTRPRPQRIHLYLYPEDRARLDGLHRQCQHYLNTPLSLSLCLRLLLATATPEVIAAGLTPPEAGQSAPSGESDTSCRG